VIAEHVDHRPSFESGGNPFQTFSASVYIARALDDVGIGWGISIVPKSRCRSASTCNFMPRSSGQFVPMLFHELFCEFIGNLVGFGIDTENLSGNGPSTGLIGHRGESDPLLRI